MTIVQAQDLLNSIYDDFIKSIYDEVPGRPRDIIINTLAEKFRKMKRVVNSRRTKSRRMKRPVIPETMKPAMGHEVIVS